MSTTTVTPEVQAKLDCLCRAKNSLRETIIELEHAFGPEAALLLATGAMRSISQIDRVSRDLAREVTHGA